MKTPAAEILKYEASLGGPPHADEVVVPGKLWTAMVEWATRMLPAALGRERATALLNDLDADERADAGPFPQPLTNLQLGEAISWRRGGWRRKPYHLGVIACSATKSAKVGTTARTLYTGELFRLSLAAAEKLCDRVVILSGWHGVLELHTKVHVYDRKVPTTKRELSAWQSNVNTSLRRVLIEISTPPGNAMMGGPEPISGLKVLMLAPQSYAKGLYLGKYPRGSGADDAPQIDSPLKGLFIGKQKSKLAELARGGA